MNPILAYVMIAVINAPSVPVAGAPVFLTPSVTVEHFYSYEGCERALKALRGYNERMVYGRCIVDQPDTPEGKTRVTLPKQAD